MRLKPFFPSAPTIYSRHRRTPKYMGAILLYLMASCSSWAQTQSWGIFDLNRGPLSGGVQVTNASTYVAAYDFKGGTVSLPGGGNSIIEGGASTELGWYFPGPRLESFVRYDFEYDANQRYPTLNGTSQFLTGGVRLKLTPRLSLTAFGSGDRSIQSAFLFRPIASSLALSSSPTAADLAGALSDRTFTGASGSPLDLLVLAGKRVEVGAGVDLKFTQSPRMTWTLTERGILERPLELEDTGSAATSVFPGVVDFDTSGGFTYSLSRQTSVGVSAGVLRSYSSAARIQVTSEGLNVEHLLSRHLFVDGRADYEILDDSVAGTKRPSVNSYGGAATAGYKGANNSFSISARRDVGDMYGLGASSTTAAVFAWQFSPSNRAWTLQNAVSTQRLSGLEAAPRLWLYQATFSRRLTSRISFIAQGVIASNSLASGAGLATIPQQGIRLSFAWTPAAVPLP